jgi:hypothetical protein
MHAHLDIRWLHLTLLLCLNKTKRNFLDENIVVDDLVNHTKYLLSELFHIGVVRFEKV